jgi:hypothetical protein
VAPFLHHIAICARLGKCRNAGHRRARRLDVDQLWPWTLASKSAPKEVLVPDKETIEKAKRKLRAGERPSTAAGEFVREEMHHIREGKHGARSPEQAIAIGLSKARRAGVPLPPPSKGAAKQRTRRSAKRAYEIGQGMRSPRAPSKQRSRAISGAMRREPHEAASHRALSEHAHRAASRRTAEERSESAKQAAATKGASGRKAAARKAARTRIRHAR